MSRQAQYAMLGRVINPRGYAAELLRDDVLPALAAQGVPAEFIDSISVCELPGDALYYVHPEELSDLVFLGACLRWFLRGQLARLPQPMVDQIAQLAARVFDYPAVVRHTDTARGRAGSQTIAAAKVEEGADNRNDVVAQWRSLAARKPPVPERNRAAKIAKHLDLSIATVNRHLTSAGLRKKEN